jgi:radical SAM protein with 4Fe4S-binding SPASM domain
MCPRTTMMTRPIETMSLETFRRVAEQLSPHSPELWQRWESFVEANYGIKRDDCSENHYFLYIIPRVVVLHGYGDPLLDKNIPEAVKILTRRGVPSYFSCNPANINVERTLETFENGLAYVKYSIEAVDDERHKQVRGSESNYTDAYRKILEVLELKAKRNLQTKLVITMLNLGKSWQLEDFAKLQKAFEGTGAYVYLKSQDQQWYEDNKIPTASIHWTEFCQFPWSSMTIKSNGQAVECVEDFNNEIILGDARTQTLEEIWNGEPYRKFRNDHFDLTPGIKCTKQCDMTLVGKLVA